MSALLNSPEESYQLWLDNFSRADAINAIINKRVFKEVFWGIPACITSDFQSILNRYRVPRYFIEYLNSCRMIGYILGQDKYDLQKVWFIYMNPDDILSYCDIQDWIPSDEIRLTQEWHQDVIILHGLLSHGTTFIEPEEFSF